MFRWMGGSEGRPAQEQGSPPPPTPQPNTTMPQPQSQIEMGSGASSSTTSAAAYRLQAPAMGGPNVSNELVPPPQTVAPQPSPVQQESVEPNEYL